MSAGEYISLGYFERDDLGCVVKHLRESGMTSKLAIWGRSMGASAALMHADIYERKDAIAGMIIDSAFTSH